MRHLLLLCLALSLAGCGLVSRNASEGEKAAARIEAKASKAQDTAIEGATASVARVDATAVAAEKARIDAELAARAKQVADEREAAAKVAAMAQATANLDPLGRAVVDKGQPDLGQGVLAEKQNLAKALNVPLPPPQIDYDALMRNAKAELAKAQSKADQLQGSLDAAKGEAVAAKAAAAAAETEAKLQREAATAARAELLKTTDNLKVMTDREREARKAVEDEKSRADWEALKSSILAGLATLATALVPVLIAMANGAFPALAPLLGPLQGVVMGALKRNDVATLAVAGSEVGKSALGALENVLSQKDPELLSKIESAVGAFTGGRVSGLVDLVETAAAAHVKDAGVGLSREVVKLVENVHDVHIDTAGGVPAILKNVLTHV